MEVIFKVNGEGNPNRRSVKPYFGRPELRTLAIIRDYGYLTSELLYGIFQQRGYNGCRKWVSYLCTHLQNLGMVRLVKRMIENNHGVYYITKQGFEALETCGCGLPYYASAPDDAASVDHFLALARISVAFHDALPVKYWLTDFVVRSENHVARERGFAKDYDAVFETTLQAQPFTVAVELEHSQKGADQYREIARSYSKDQYAHLVLFVVERQSWIDQIANAMGANAEQVCFVERGELLSHSLTECSAFRLINNVVTKNWLSVYMLDASKIDRPTYSPRFGQYPF